MQGRFGETPYAAAVLRTPVMLYNDAALTGESLQFPYPCKIRYAVQPKEGKQTNCRQSDSRIVPMKVGNATGGKPRKKRASRFCYVK